jgi:hypothetical protein
MALREVALISMPGRDLVFKNYQLCIAVYRVFGNHIENTRGAEGYVNQAGYDLYV